MERLRIVLISEAPFVVSSMGKVVYGLSTRLAAMGHEVAVVSVSGAPSPTLISFDTVFNPRRWAAAHGSPLADIYPDVDVVVVPWGRLYPLETAVSRVGRPDVVIVYGYPYLDQELNHAVYELFTSRGVPAIAYALHEGPSMPEDAALSTLAYSAVATPTRVVRDQYLSSLRRAAQLRMRSVDVELVSRYFTVVPHGVDTRVYGREGAEAVASRYLAERVEGCDVVVGMVAKNHVRKDYLGLARVVAELRRRGYAVCAGMYMVDAVSPGHWRIDEIRRAVLDLHSVDIDSAVLRLPDPWRTHGMPEDALVALYTRYMDVHLFLTRGESFGLPPLESALLGVPTLTSDIPPQREVFEGTGVPLIRSYVCTLDTLTLYCQDLRDAVERTAEAIEDLEGLRRAVERARAVLAERFSAEAMARAMLNTVRLALEKPEPLSRLAPLL